MSSAVPSTISAKTTLLLEGDLDTDSFDTALTSDSLLLPWDTETSGLAWDKERLSIVQLLIGDTPIIVRNLNRHPYRLIALLENSDLRKVFHHAMFDLRFMAHHWEAQPKNIVYTKIMSKLLDPSEGAKHSLGLLLEQHFNVTLDKDPSVRVSNWDDENLTARQMLYAVNDVLYLPALAEKLTTELREKGLEQLAEQCFAHLPTRVKLELGGYGDVFTY